MFRPAWISSLSILAQAAALGAAMAKSERLPGQDEPHEMIRQSASAAGTWVESGSANSHAAPTSSPSADAEEESVASEDRAALLARMQEAGLIKDVRPWQAIFEGGKPCPPGMVRELIMAAAEKFAPSPDVETALEVLVANKVIIVPDYWREVLLQNQTVASGVMTTLAKRILVVSGKQ